MMTMVVCRGAQLDLRWTFHGRQHNTKEAAYKERLEKGLHRGICKCSHDEWILLVVSDFGCVQYN